MEAAVRFEFGGFPPIEAWDKHGHQTVRVLKRRY
jgi:hypothetical protein